MKRRGVLGGLMSVFGLVGWAASPAQAAGGTAVVTTASDSGPGSLRAALASGATRIVIGHRVGTINVQSPLTYAGAAGITVLGSGQTIAGRGVSGALLDITAGADLSIAGLTFDGSGGAGVRVTVPPTRTGTVKATFDRFTVRNTADHGVLIDDEAGSTAAVTVRMIGSTIERGGIANPDQDGVRVNERGEGGITFHSVSSTFAESGGDGVELDEGGPGDVAVDDIKSSFRANGPLVADDLEDGIDVDEAGAGSVRTNFAGTTFVDNFDEGADLNELDDGGITARFVGVVGTGTVDGEAIALEELGTGDVDLSLAKVTTSGNGDDGVQVEELDDGTARVDAVAFTSSANGSDGLHLEEGVAGDVRIRIAASSITGNADDGIQAEQQAPGAGTLRLLATDVSGNADDQLNLDGVTQL